MNLTLYDELIELYKEIDLVCDCGDTYKDCLTCAKLDSNPELSEFKCRFNNLRIFPEKLMPRVNLGEKYYFIIMNSRSNKLEVYNEVENFDNTSLKHHLSGNYYCDKETAESLCTELKKVIESFNKRIINVKEWMCSK